MLSSSRGIRRTPGLDRSYTMTDLERLARIIPWSAGVADPIAWFLNCPGSELCDGHFDWRDPEMSVIQKTILFCLLRRLQEFQEELRLLRSRVRRTRWIKIGQRFLLGLFCAGQVCSMLGVSISELF